MDFIRILAGVIITILVVTDLLANSVAPYLLGLIGEFYLDQEKYQAAINVSSAGITLKPGNVELYRIRAEAYKNTSELNQALEDINQAISIFEDDWSYHSLRGKDQPRPRKLSRCPF